MRSAKARSSGDKRNRSGVAFVAIRKVAAFMTFRNVAEANVLPTHARAADMIAASGSIVIGAIPESLRKSWCG
jgi:hypothetical protein